MPVAVEGEGRVERLIVERTGLDRRPASVGTGERYTVECGLVVSCIGYQTPPIEGVPYEHGRGRFANQDGVIADGLYCVGWARRGPTGTIGTNRPDGFEVAEKIFAAFGPGGGGKPGGAGPRHSAPRPRRRAGRLPRLAADRGRRDRPRPRGQPAREVHQHRRDDRRARPLGRGACAPSAPPLWSAPVSRAAFEPDPVGE